MSEKETGVRAGLGEIKQGLGPGMLRVWDFTLKVIWSH